MGELCMSPHLLCLLFSFLMVLFLAANFMVLFLAAFCPLVVVYI